MLSDWAVDANFLHSLSSHLNFATSHLRKVNDFIVEASR